MEAAEKAEREACEIAFGIVTRNTSGIPALPIGIALRAAAKVAAHLASDADEESTIAWTVDSFRECLRDCLRDQRLADAQCEGGVQ